MITADDLTRDMVRRADEEAQGDNGTFAEVLTAELYGWRHTPDETDWYDCRDADRGTKAEVKAAQTVIDGLDEDRRVEVAGRVRVWRGQLRSLLSSASAEGQTAWVVFWLLDEDGGPLEVRRAKPSTVWRWVTEEMNGWDASGHANPDRNEQQKLPLGLVFDGVKR